MTVDTIAIIGFMGVGKSTVGKLLAQHLQWTFVDLDQSIEKEVGTSIPDIFNTDGERAFREKEREIALRLCGAEGQQRVVALGGGAFTQYEIRQHYLQRSFVILLDISWENWRTSRMPAVIATRPLLQNKPLEQIERLFHDRLPSYSYHYRINMDGVEPLEAVEQIIKMLHPSYSSHGAALYRALIDRP